MLDGTMEDAGTIDLHAVATRRGREVEVTLVLEIPESVHIEPHVPDDPLLIPTVIDFDGLDAKEIEYPLPEEKDLGFSGIPPLSVYEGRKVVTAVLHAPDPVRTISGTIRYQPCVGGACLPPRTQTWRAPVQARRLTLPGMLDARRRRHGPVRGTISGPVASSRRAG